MGEVKTEVHHVNLDLSPTSERQQRNRAWLKCFNFSRAKFYLPLALCTGASYVLKKGFMSWLVLFVCTLGACVLLLPVGYAIWRQQQLMGTDN